MASKTADVVVIGMGVGGEWVAGTLAERGLDVVGIEDALVGGECPYWGCIPSKMMIRAANAIAEARRIDGLAGIASVEPDFAPVARRIREEATDNWNDQVAVDRFVGKGGRFLRGRGELIGPHRVRVTGPDGALTEIDAGRAVVLATGTQAAIPPVPGLAEVDYWTNHEAIENEAVPETLAVLGGGAIGLELAQAYARFGSETTIVELFDRVLYYEEPEASAVVAEALAAEGITVLTGDPAVEVKSSGDEITLTLDDGKTVTAQRLIVATGRRTDLGALGLATVGLDPEGRFITVDDHLRVLDGTHHPVPGLWAVGDITGKGLFTHIAAYQARFAIAGILGESGPAADYRALPRVTFTDPEVGATGLTEAQARDAGLSVATAVKPVPHTARGWMHKTGNEGLIKLVADTERDVLVGATSVGPHGGEVLGLLELAVHAAVPITELRSMIYAYPTFYRGIQDALGELGREADA